MRRHLLSLFATLLLPLQVAATTIDLSVVNGDTRIVGADANGFVGLTVRAGDVNGDSLKDLILGAAGASPGGRAFAGRVYVFFGTGDTLATTIDLAVATPDVVIEGNYASGQFGQRIATGDLNGDGIGDIIAGAPFASPAAGTNAGIAYVIYGDSTWSGTTIDLSTTSADVTLTGGAGQEVGTGLAAGDIDGNGVDDLVVGAPKAEGPSRPAAGRVHTIYADTVGSGNELAATYNLGLHVADFVIFGRDASDNLGNDIIVEDMDADGLAEVIAAAFLANPDGEDNGGEVYVIEGRANYKAEFPAGTYSIPSTVLSPLYAIVKGDLEFGQAGYSIAVGDLTYDDVPDLAIGANGESPSGRTAAGKVFVVDGTVLPGLTDLAVPEDVKFAVWGAVASDNVGFSVAVLNANGDGMDDLLVGAPFAAGFAGQAYVVFGDQQSSVIDLATDSADITILGDDASDLTGYAVSSIDVDGNGIEDLILGSPGATGANASAGEVVVLLNSPPAVEMAPADTFATYGSTAILPLRVTAMTGLKMIEADLDLLYDSDVITYTGYDATGTLMAAWDTVNVDTIAGGANPDTLRIHGRTLGASSSSPGTFLALTFDVTTSPQLDTSDLSIDHLLFNGGRTEWNTLSDGIFVVIGTDGELAATVLSSPGDTVRIRMIDHDTNFDALTAETLVATTTNVRTGEVETLQLLESTVDDSVFFGTLLTVGAPGAGVDDDGTMQVADDDSLIVSVMDSLDASGAATVRQVDHLVLDPLGDADDNGTLQAYDASRILAHAVGLITLADRDSLAANVDALAPGGLIDAFDAVFVIQRVLGLIDRFPVQSDSSANHPQPQTDDSVSKILPEMIAVSWQRDGSELVLVADERRHILAGDLQIHGLPTAAVIRPAADLSGALAVHQHDQGTLKVGLAIPYPVDGPGELLRVGPKPGTILPAFSQVQLEGQFNGGTLGLRVQVAQRDITTRPRELQLHKNFPNPFNAETTIRFDLPQAESVELSIYNSVGQRIRTLVDGVQSAGNHQIVWDSRTDEGQLVASGTYVYVLQSSDLRIARPLLLLK
ncbi:MAG: T9SS type A sorting domain-containing protein [Gemmatimonadetes bacterium]|nr:T9SS type A sorting domain-containing protein [Gemmatimonadota bacterium]